MFWNGAPRWLYTSIYIGSGGSRSSLHTRLHRRRRSTATGVAIATAVLVVVGGLLYTRGAVIYGLKKPNPKPEWFGFHEVFHTFTILAFIAHYVAVSPATLLPSPMRRTSSTMRHASRSRANSHIAASSLAGTDVPVGFDGVAIMIARVLSSWSSMVRPATPFCAAVPSGRSVEVGASNA